MKGKVIPGIPVSQFDERKSDTWNSGHGKISEKRAIMRIPVMVKLRLKSDIGIPVMVN